MKIKDDENILYLHINQFDEIRCGGTGLYDFLMTYKSEVLTGLMKVCLEDKFMVSSIIKMSKCEAEWGVCFQNESRLTFCKHCSFF